MCRRNYSLCGDHAGGNDSAPDYRWGRTPRLHLGRGVTMLFRKYEQAPGCSYSCCCRLPKADFLSVIPNNRRAKKRCRSLTTAICCLASAISFAQETQPGPPPDAPSAAAQAKTAPQGNNPLQGGVAFVQLLQRKSVVFPDIATSRGPLSAWEKFKLASNDSVSLSTISAALIGAGYRQAVDSPAGYGQGGAGYGKRLGSGMARAASDNLFGTFLISSVLHDDPRFYVKKHLTFKQAVKYSAARLVITRSDSGDRAVNYAGLLGPLAAEALANTYYPEGSRSVGDAFARYGGDLAWKFGGNLTRQYWPKINRKLRLAPQPGEPAKPSPNQP